MLLSKLLHYVIVTSAKHGIDDSHGIAHSMNVLNYAQKIYESELVQKKYLKNQKNIIYTSAILHDMCDSKYMDKFEEINRIDDYLKETKLLDPNEISVSKEIMSTMSYSHVKKHGFPNLGSYQTSYHIVREADLLTAYDFDRSIIYDMCRNGKNMSIEESYDNAFELFKKRVLRHNTDELFVSEYALKESIVLHGTAMKRIDNWQSILKKKLIF